MRASQPGRNRGKQTGRGTFPACSASSIYSKLATIIIVPTLHGWHSTQVNDAYTPWLPQGRGHFGGTLPAPEHACLLPAVQQARLDDIAMVICAAGASTRWHHHAPRTTRHQAMRRSTTGRLGSPARRAPRQHPQTPRSGNDPSSTITVERLNSPVHAVSQTERRSRSRCA